jgi:hypothetical protein
MHENVTCTHSGFSFLSFSLSAISLGAGPLVDPFWLHLYGSFFRGLRQCLFLVLRHEKSLIRSRSLSVALRVVRGDEKGTLEI